MDDEEQRYCGAQLAGYPPWQHIFPDAFAALCTLHLDCWSVCASLLEATHHVLLALPDPATTQLQEAMARCFAELQSLAEPCESPLQAALAEDRFIQTAYHTRYAANRALVVDEAGKALLLLDAAIKQAQVSQDPTDGEDGEDRTYVRVPCDYDDCTDEYEYERAVMRSDVPRLVGLCQALRLCSPPWTRAKTVSLSITSGSRSSGAKRTPRWPPSSGASVCVHPSICIVADRKCNTEYSLCATIVRRICALPWAVHTYARAHRTKLNHSSTASGNDADVGHMDRSAAAACFLP